MLINLFPQLLSPFFLIYHSSLRIHLSELMQLRQKATIGEVLEHLKETKRPRLSAKLEQAELKYSKFNNLRAEELSESEQRFYTKISSLKSIKYSELIELAKYLNEKTPFSTKHGVKGAEFENVLVVCGRGWNNYNWNNFLSWQTDGIPKGKESSYERNRNLFYVACSRPKKRLGLLFTQQLSDSALSTLNDWFLKSNVSSKVLDD